MPMPSSRGEWPRIFPSLVDCGSGGTITVGLLLGYTREAAARADEYVRDNPWTGVGIGAAVGVVLGVLLTRR